jgi:hypothetical protein
MRRMREGWRMREGQDDEGTRAMHELNAIEEC